MLQHPNLPPVLEVRPSTTEHSETTPPLTQWQRWAWCLPGHCGSFCLPRHTAGSHSTCHNPNITFHGATLHLLVFSLYIDPVLSHPRCRIQQQLLLNFMQFVIAQPSNMPRSLCRACLPSRESTAPSWCHLQAYLVYLQETYPSN